MSTDEPRSAMLALALDKEERTVLLGLLEQALGETRVEVHRTHTPDSRMQVQHRLDEPTAPGGPVGIGSRVAPRVRAISPAGLFFLAPPRESDHEHHDPPRKSEQHILQAIMTRNWPGS